MLTRHHRPSQGSHSVAAPAGTQAAMAPIRPGDGRLAVKKEERAIFAASRRAAVSTLATEIRELKASKASKELVRCKAWELLEEKYLLCLHTPEPITAPELVVATTPTKVMKVRWAIQVEPQQEDNLRGSGSSREGAKKNPVKLQHQFYNRIKLSGDEVIEAIQAQTARRFPELATSVCKLEVVVRKEGTKDGKACVRKLYCQLLPTTVLRMPLANPGPVLAESTTVEVRATFQRVPKGLPADFPPLVDMGTNLSSERFASNLGQVIDRGVHAGVVQMVNLATELCDSKFGVELAISRPGTLYTTIGVHPSQASLVLDKMSLDGARSALRGIHRESQVSQLYYGEPCSSHPTVVAIGEAGLNFEGATSAENKDQQLKLLEMQFELAVELSLPIIVQERGAFEDMVVLAKKYHAQLPSMILICFNGPTSHLQAYVDLGMYIGVTGLVCNVARNSNIEAALREVPEARQRLVLSSDAPYLTPFNMPKPFPKDNEPFTLGHVVRQLAVLLGEDCCVLANEITERSRACLQLCISQLPQTEVAVKAHKTHKAIPSDNPNAAFAFYGPAIKQFCAGQN